MEFFRTLAFKADEDLLHCCLTNSNLDQFSNLIFPIGETSDGSVEIGGLWGEFTLMRSEIRGGVRFALKECPNALAWTVTAGFPPAPNGVTIHLTINRKRKNGALIQEINEFLDDHHQSLQEFLLSAKKEACTS